MSGHILMRRNELCCHLLELSAEIILRLGHCIRCPLLPRPCLTIVKSKCRLWLVTLILELACISRNNVRWKSQIRLSSRLLHRDCLVDTHSFLMLSHNSTGCHVHYFVTDRTSCRLRCLRLLYLRLILFYSSHFARPFFVLRKVHQKHSLIIAHESIVWE